MTWMPGCKLESRSRCHSLKRRRGYILVVEAQAPTSFGACFQLPFDQALKAMSFSGHCAIHKNMLAVASSFWCR